MRTSIAHPVLYCQSSCCGWLEHLCLSVGFTVCLIGLQTHFCHAQHGDVSAETVPAAVPLAFFLFENDDLLVLRLLLAHGFDLRVRQGGHRGIRGDAGTTTANICQFSQNNLSPPQLPEQRVCRYNYGACLRWGALRRDRFRCRRQRLSASPWWEHRPKWFNNLLFEQNFQARTSKNSRPYVCQSKKKKNMHHTIKPAGSQPRVKYIYIYIYTVQNDKRDVSHTRQTDSKYQK